MKKLFAFFLAAILLLSCTMCAVVAYNYRAMLDAIKHDGASAPASIAILYAIPYLILIAVSIVGAAICRKKSKGENKQCQK